VYEFIVNAGTFRTSAAAGSTSVQVRLDNTGTVAAQSGTLSFARGGTLGGTFSAQAGAAVQFTYGTFVLSGSLAKSGAGQVGFTGGSIQFTGPITSFDHTGASLIGTNTVTGTLNWMGGDIQGPLTVAAGAVLNLGGTADKEVYQPLTNWGTINWLSRGLSLANNNSSSRGAIYNQAGALFDVQCDQTLSTGGWGYEFIVNAGTFRKSAVTGTTQIQVRFDNSGTVEAAKGTISFSSGSYTSAPTSNLRFILSGTTAGTGFGQVRFGTPLVPAGIVSGEVVTGFNPPTGTGFQVISGGLAATPLGIDRNAGNGYVFDFFGAGDTLTLVTRPGHFTLPPLLSLLYVRPGIWSLLLEGAPGLTYRVFSASDVRETPPTDWTPLRTNTTASGLVQLLITNNSPPAILPGRDAVSGSATQS
jgi:hypothetical protein